MRGADGRNKEMCRIISHSPLDLMHCFEGDQTSETVTKECKFLAIQQVGYNGICKIAHQKPEIQVRFLPEPSFSSGQVNDRRFNVRTEQISPAPKRGWRTAGVRNTEKSNCSSIRTARALEHRQMVTKSVTKYEN